MKERIIKNRFLLYLFVLSACFIFTASNVFAQLIEKSETVARESEAVVNESGAIAEESDTEALRPFSISLNAVDDAELTGEMFVRFYIENEENYPYHENYDYYYDANRRVWPDKVAYIHSLVRETDPKTSAQAIYSFTIPPGICGLFKIEETVWAKDCGHDSFFVEVKKRNRRIPFAAWTSNGRIIFVKKAHDRFELNGTHGSWHDKSVCHWNAYYPPYERTCECCYFLSPGNYKLIYTAREDLTRLSAIKIVRVFPLPPPEISQPLTDEYEEELEKAELIKYFDNFKTECQYPAEILELESVKDDLGLNK